MGMDYQWSGSASYPRFNEEFSNVAKVFGGSKSENLAVHCRFTLPEGTDPVLVKWLNDPYDDFTAEETKIVWQHVCKHPEIQEISHQIWNELKCSTEYDEGWDIY